MIKKMSPVNPEACGRLVFLESEQELKAKAEKHKRNKRYFMNKGI
jgi:hypothetical protein